MKYDLEYIEEESFVDGNNDVLLEVT